MRKHHTVEIAKLCLSVDVRARNIYAELASAAQDDKLKSFWQEMSDDEAMHVRFWQEAVKLAENDLMPDVLDDDEGTIIELQNIIQKIDGLWEQYRQDPGLSKALIMAYRLEFFALHDVFETIFHALSTMETVSNPDDSYDSHLQRLVDILVEYGEGIPEIELLGDTLQRLWRKNRELARQISIDELTGIYNRRGFYNAAKPILHLARRNQQAVGILMLDIDDFKKINDTHGHPIGDEALIRMARILEEGVRASDVLARYGGEEFIILFSSIKSDFIFQLAEKIRNIVVEKTLKHIPMTASIGISAGGMGANVNESLVALIKGADDCLYAAKHSGKNQVSYCSMQ